MPTADSSAYDGNIVVKRTTFGRANRDSSKSVEADRVKRAVNILEGVMSSKLSIDGFDLLGEDDLRFQLFVNKEVVVQLRKVNNMLRTFIANNGQSVDNE